MKKMFFFTALILISFAAKSQTSFEIYAILMNDENIESHVGIIVVEEDGNVISVNTTEYEFKVLVDPSSLYEEENSNGDYFQHWDAFCIDSALQISLTTAIFKSGTIMFSFYDDETIVTFCVNPI